ncbi:CoA-binding protein [Phycomyces nitens]|nr:CoA-binding protein [Phycomyces nitens]
MSTVQRFIQCKQFAVVGASPSREKFGNRILRWYQSNQLPVIPINPKERSIENLVTLASIDGLLDPQHTGLSIITPPKVTLDILKKAKALGIKNIWIQPGAEDTEVIDYCKQENLDVIAGGPCLLVQGPALLPQRSRL